MTAPRLGMGMPPDDSWIPRRLDDLQRQLNELRAARTLEAATIGKGGLTVAGGTLTVEGGKLVVDGAGIAESGNYVPGSAGWALQPNGNAEFNDLTLRGGIIGNDALTAPVVPNSFFTDDTGLSLTTSSRTYASTAIAVPAGYSRAVVIAQVAAQLDMPGAAVTLSCQAFSSAPSVIGTPGVGVGAGGNVSVSASGHGQAVDSLSQVADLTGLSSFTIAAYVFVSAAVATYSASVSVSGAVMFLR